MQTAELNNLNNVLSCRVFDERKNEVLWILRREKHVFNMSNKYICHIFSI